MKNLAKTIVPLLLGIVIGYYLCGSDGPSNPVDDGNNNEGPAADVKAPPGIISVAQAIDLHKTYVGESEGVFNRYQTINKVVANTLEMDDFKDTQFVWFPMDEIRDYVKYLNKVERKNPKNPKISGIRIYFGAYDGQGKYPYQQTVFMTPTVNTQLGDSYENMNNVPFYIEPKKARKPLVGKYKVIHQLLLKHNTKYRTLQSDKYLASMYEEAEQEQQQQEQTNEDGIVAMNLPGPGDTSLSYNLGQAGPPPPKNQ